MPFQVVYGTTVGSVIQWPYDLGKKIFFLNSGKRKSRVVGCLIFQVVSKEVAIMDNEHV